MSAAVIKRLAHEITRSGSAAAMIGGAPLAHTNGLFNALAVNALESLVDAGRDQGPIWALRRSRRQRSTGRSRGLAASMLSRSHVGAERAADAFPLRGKSDFFGSSEPRIREAIAKIPYIVSFGSFIDETSAQADLILPDHAPLESWLESVRVGIVPNGGQSCPASRSPLHNTRPMPDVLLGLAQKLGGEVAKAFLR